MKKAIEWLIFHPDISNYQISKATGISQVVLNKYRQGKSDVGRMTLDNALKLHEYFKEVLSDMEKQFGTVEFEGTEYILMDQADFTNRQLLKWQEEEGYAEFSAPATDGKGNSYKVLWLQKLVFDNGERVEDLSDLDWSNPVDVRQI